jgi:hypothetical protein
LAKELGQQPKKGQFSRSGKLIGKNVKNKLLKAEKRIKTICK